MDRLSGVCHLDVGGDMGEVGERESARERFGQSKSWGAQDNSIISLASGWAAPASKDKLICLNCEVCLFPIA
jgi:hypothetical protein